MDVLTHGVGGGLTHVEFEATDVGLCGSHQPSSSIWKIGLWMLSVGDGNTHQAHRVYHSGLLRLAPEYVSDIQMHDYAKLVLTLAHPQRQHKKGIPTSDNAQLR